MEELYAVSQIKWQVKGCLGGLLLLQQCQFSHFSHFEAKHFFVIKVW